MRYLPTLLLALSLHCPVPTPPTPPVEPLVVWHVYVKAVTTLQPIQGAEVYFNGFLLNTNADGYAARALHKGVNGIVVKAEGYVEQSIDQDLQGVEVVTEVNLEPVFKPMQRLMVCGINFCREDGTRWNWYGITAFSLAYDIATGQQQKVEEFLDFAKENNVTIIRVFTTAVNLFNLDPAAGRDAVERVLELSGHRGIYTEVVGLVDTAQRQFDHSDHLWRLGVLCSRYPNCLIEVANEPDHPTQDSRVKEVGYLLGLRKLVKDVSPETLVALGAAHGTSDESTAYWGGDYATVHGDRKGGWDSVRHVREMQALRDGPLALAGPLHKPVVNDEPDRNLSPDQHLGMALLTRLYALGDTFHYAGGLHGSIPTPGAELDAFQARRRGWLALPGDWQGRYSRATLAGDPIISLDDAQILRAYSSLQNIEGYTLGLRVQSETSIRWGNGWRPQLLISDELVRLWHVQK